MRRFFVVIIVATITGCGWCGGTLKQLDSTNETTSATLQQTRPVLQDMADEAIDDCKAAKITNLAACPGYIRVRDVRRAIVKTAQGIFVTVKLGALSIMLGDEADAKKKLAEVLAAAVVLKQQISEMVKR